MKVPVFIVAVLLSVPLAWAQNNALNFDNLPESAKVTSQFTGLTFANATVVTAGVTLNEFEFPPRSGSRVAFNDGGAMMINFTPPIYGVEGYFTYNSRITLLAFDVGGNQIGIALSQFTNNLALSGVAGSKANELLSFASISPIAKIIISSQDNGAYVLDDFRITDTTVPTIYEADVSPRPNGNQSLTLSDWVQAGRFAIGLDSITAGVEYQRADSAPRATKGDGVITIGDWVQAGRYAAGLDPITIVGGPTTLSSFAAKVEANQTLVAESSRAIIATADTRDLGVLFIRLEAQGNENALGFSLSFDPKIVEFAGATLESDSAGATLILNQNQTKSGLVGMALALPTGKALPVKSSSLLKVRFNPVGNDYPASTPISFGDTPTRRSLVDTNANNLPGTYSDVSLPLRGRDGPSRRDPTKRGTTPRP